MHLVASAEESVFLEKYTLELKKNRCFHSNSHYENPFLYKQHVPISMH